MKDIETVLAIANLLVEKLDIDTEKVEHISFNQSRTLVTLTINLKQ